MNNRGEETPREILVVENNPADVRMVVEAWKGGRVKTHLTALRSGAEALAFLHCEGPHRGASRPDLVLIDLNLARKSGQDLLAAMKRDPHLRRLPVIVLTTSDARPRTSAKAGRFKRAYLPCLPSRSPTGDGITWPSSLHC